MIAGAFVRGPCSPSGRGARREPTAFRTFSSPLGVCPLVSPVNPAHPPPPRSAHTRRRARTRRSGRGRVGDVDVARAIGGDARGGVELPGAAAQVPQLAGAGTGLKLAGAVGNAPAVGPDERAGGGELIDSGRIRDVHVARGIDGDAPGPKSSPAPPPSPPARQVVVHISNRAGAVAHAPAIGLDERAGGGELIDPVVAGIGDVDVARAIGGDALGLVELPAAAAVAPDWQVVVQVSNWLAPSLTPQP